MHNLHVIVTKADTPKQACRDVENFISNWGDDDNWRIIIGCVEKETKKVYYHDESRHFTLTEDDILVINDECRHMLSNYGKMDDRLHALLGKLPPSEEENIAYYDWYNLEKWAHKNKLLCEKLKFTDTFDLFEHELFEYEYDEVGVTHTGYSGSNTYAVFVDMHS